MRAYYNEWDLPTAAWLQTLGGRHHLPAGQVDTRSIRDVSPDDVRGFDQCHFFAGIGGWPLALRLAGYEQLPCWTGSPPCQPYSVAGQQRGNDDDRHLAPVWLDLVRECLPPILFGEQVADAIRHGWLDDLFDALEECGYACGAAVLPACSVGAPHIRKRLFFGAVRLAHADKNRCEQGRTLRSVCAEYDAQYGSTESGLAHALGTRRGQTGCDAPCDRKKAKGWPGNRNRDGSADDVDIRVVGAHGAYSHHGLWSGADWLGCRDGKFRPVEPQVLGMADGLPSGMVQSGIISASNPLAEKQEARVMRLRGYGNAIVPAVAAVFIKEFLGAVNEAM